MISSFNSTAQTVEIGSAFVFDTNRIVTGCTVGHTPGSTIFTLTKPGYYYITFNSVFSTEATGDVTVTLLNKGVAISGATATETISTAGDTKSISFATVVRVSSSCCAIDNTASLSFSVDGLAIDATTAAVQITKLC